MPRLFRILTAAFAIAALQLGASPAMAQAQLPDDSDGGPPILGGVVVRAPHQSTLTGRELRLNGDSGRLAFEQQGDALVISRIMLAGRKISAPGQACEVDVAGGPFVLRPLRRAQGLRRFEGSIPECKFSVEIHNGAAQVSVGYFRESSPTGGYCAFKAADCRASLAGFWGPADESINRADILQNDRIRGASEKNAQANYRALVTSLAKDRPHVRMIASEQASFSSRRTERCEYYAGEVRHGFCASRMTEAWAIALRARQNPDAFEAEETNVAARSRAGRRQAIQSAAPDEDTVLQNHAVTRLPTKKRTLSRQTPVIAGHGAGRAKHAVARNDKRDRVAPNRRADRAGSFQAPY